MKIELIKPYPKNAKRHPQKQIQQIANSIKEFGFNQPIVVDKNNVVIVGHGRLEAAKLLKLKDVEVIKVNLSDEKAKAYRLADNKLNESDWDMELVIEELKTLSLPMVDLTGFERDLIIEAEDKDDVVPSLPSKPKTRIGDIYQLGDHLLMCGDSTDIVRVRELMENREADMVFTDPPYNVNYKGRGKKTSNTIENDDMDEGAFYTFLEKAFRCYQTVIKTGAGMYVFHSSSSQATFERALTETGFTVKNQLVWNKPVASMGWGDYRWKHEPFFYCCLKEEKVQFYGDRTHTTIWDFQDSDEALFNWVKKQRRLDKAGLTTIWTMKRDNVQEYVHPTQKPVELICYAISNSSKKGDIVLDLFGGSGSTLIACHKMGRKGYLMELDPKYCDVIVQRYVDYTGNSGIIKNNNDMDWPLSEKALKRHAKTKDTEESGEAS